MKCFRTSEGGQEALHTVKRPAHPTGSWHQRIIWRRGAVNEPEKIVVGCRKRGASRQPEGCWLSTRASFRQPTTIFSSLHGQKRVVGCRKVKEPVGLNRTRTVPSAQNTWYSQNNQHACITRAPRTTTKQYTVDRELQVLI